MTLKFSRISFSHPPEICERSVIPQLLSVRHFIKTCYPDSILIRGYMLCLNIHRYLTQVEVRSYPCCCCYTGLCKHILYDRHGKIVRTHLIYPKIIRHIHEHLIYGIHMHILWCYILQIDVIYIRTVLHVICHTWRSGYIRNRKFIMLRKLIGIAALPGKVSTG